MADVVEKSTLIPSYSVHTPDYDPGFFLIHPAGLPALDAASVPIKYRKLITGDTDVGEMTQGEKDAYDAANPPPDPRPVAETVLTTTQRDAMVGPVAGMLICNSTTKTIDQHDGAAWVPVFWPGLDNQYDLARTANRYAKAYFAQTIDSDLHADVVGLLIKANASQTDDLLKLLDSAGAKLVVIDAAGLVTISPNPTGQTASASADDLVIDNSSGTAGISILTTATQTGHIFFGDTADNDVGRVSYLHNGNLFKFRVQATFVLEMRLDRIQSLGSWALSNVAEGATGRYNQTSEYELVTLSGTSKDTTLAIPSGAKIIGVQMTVDEAVVNGGDNTWAANLITGSTAEVAAAGTAAALNTKINKMLAEITTAVTEVQFTPQAGSFTAGKIAVTVFYEYFTPMADV